MGCIFPQLRGWTPWPWPATVAWVRSNLSENDVDFVGFFPLCFHDNNGGQTMKRNLEFEDSISKLIDMWWLLKAYICKSTARRSYFYTNPKWVDSRCVDQLAPQKSEFGDQAEKLWQFQGFKNENSWFITAQKKTVLLNPKTSHTLGHVTILKGTFELSRWFSGLKVPGCL